MSDNHSPIHSSVFSHCRPCAFNLVSAAIRAFSLLSVKESSPFLLPALPPHEPNIGILLWLSSEFGDPSTVPDPMNAVVADDPAPSSFLSLPGRPNTWNPEEPPPELPPPAFGPTGASSNNFLGSKHEQHTPQSANLLTCPGMERPRSLHTKAFAKWLQFFRIRLYRSGPKSSLRSEIADCTSDDPPSKVPNSIASRNCAPGASLGELSKMPPPLAKLYSLPNISTPLWWIPMPTLYKKSFAAERSYTFSITFVPIRVRPPS
mmetsp:Transcript_33188/g.80287  ORF Transcript_33188/g.80287 Transcript_33188/m.80287 type:complete len:262 (-) Transcript_33188:173-958(-)